MSSRCLLLPVCHCLSVCQSPCEAKNLGGTYSLVQLRLDTKGWRAPRVSFLISVGGRQSDCLAYFPAPHCQTLCGGDRSCCLWDLCIAVLRYLKLLGFKKGKFAWLPEVHVPLALLLQTCSDSIYHRRSLWQKWLIDRMVARKQREKCRARAWVMSPSRSNLSPLAFPQVPPLLHRVGAKPPSPGP